jgi:hypothetical protein
MPDNDKQLDRENEEGFHGLRVKRLVNGHAEKVFLSRRGSRFQEAIRVLKIAKAKTPVKIGHMAPFCQVSLLSKV